MNGHILVFAMGVIFAISIRSLSAEETTTQLSLDSVLSKIKNSETFKDVSEKLKNFDLQQAIPKMQEAVQPLLKNLNTSGLLNQFKTGTDAPLGSSNGNSQNESTTNGFLDQFKTFGSIGKNLQNGFNANSILDQVKTGTNPLEAFGKNFPNGFDANSFINQMKTGAGPLLDSFNKKTSS